MAKAKADIRGLSIPEKIARGRKLESGLKGNTLLPPGTGDTLAALVKGQTDALETAYNTQLVSKNQWLMDSSAQNTSETAWDGVINTLVTKVDDLSGGDEIIIKSTELGVVDSSATPLPAPAKVLNLQLTQGDEPGHIDAHWDGQKIATGYAVEFWVGEDVLKAQWNFGPPVKGKSSKVEFKNLPSDVIVWVRARALNTHEGPWSEPVFVRTP